MSQCVKLEAVQVWRREAADLKVDLTVMIGRRESLYLMLSLFIPVLESLEGAGEAVGEIIQRDQGISDDSGARTVGLSIGHPSQVFNQQFIVLPLLDETVLFPFKV